MNCTLRKAVCGMTAAWALALLAASAQADVFLSGMPQGAPGADVDLSIMAGAGTTYRINRHRAADTSTSTRCSRC